MKNSAELGIYARLKTQLEAWSLVSDYVQIWWLLSAIHCLIKQAANGETVGLHIMERDKLWMHPF